MTEIAPLVTPETDVRDLDGFMLNVERMLASELWALSTGEEFKAAFALWMRAWKQFPAGSLPNDERVLAAFSGAGKRWASVREMALRGFVKCSDGRLYHRVLCEDVRRAFLKKGERRERTKAATLARQRRRDEERDEQRHDDRNDERPVIRDDNFHVQRNEGRDVRDNMNVTTSQGQGQGRSKKEGSEANASGGAVPPDDPVKALWDRGLTILGEKNRALLGKARREYGDVEVFAAIKSCEDEQPSDPAGFFFGCLTAARKRKNGTPNPNEGVF